MMGKVSSTQGSDWRFMHKFDPKILKGIVHFDDKEADGKTMRDFRLPPRSR